MEGKQLRREGWIGGLAPKLVGEKWIILEDFNEVVHSGECFGPANYSNSEPSEFRDMLKKMELLEMQMKGKIFK